MTKSANDNMMTRSHLTDAGRSPKGGPEPARPPSKSATAVVVVVVVVVVTSPLGGVCVGGQMP